MPSIIIPTCLSESEIMPMLIELSGYCVGCEIIPTGLKESASKNRNEGLRRASKNLIIMIDDDVYGFYEGWWKDLVDPLIDLNNIMVSARLINKDKTPANMVCEDYRFAPEIIEIANKNPPSAAIAFRKGNTLFDEGFRGSGFEDTLFCYELAQKYPDGKFLINNKCQLVHDNEQKEQNVNFTHNEAYYRKRVREMALGKS